MSRFVATIALISLLFISQPATCVEFYAGPSLHLVNATSDQFGEHLGIGGYGGANLLQFGWGSLGIELDGGLPISSGNRPQVGGDWSISWLSAGLYYRTPRRLFLKARLSYQYIWYRTEIGSTVHRDDDGGDTVSLGLAYMVSEGGELSLAYGYLCGLMHGDEKISNVYRITLGYAFHF